MSKSLLVSLSVTTKTTSKDFKAIYRLLARQVNLTIWSTSCLKFHLIFFRSLRLQTLVVLTGICQKNKNSNYPTTLMLKIQY